MRPRASAEGWFAAFLPPHCSEMSQSLRFHGIAFAPSPRIHAISRRPHRGSFCRCVGTAPRADLASRADARASPGAGLGSAIAKELMDQLGGRIRVEDTAGGARPCACRSPSLATRRQSRALDDCVDSAKIAKSCWNSPGAGQDTPLRAPLDTARFAPPSFRMMRTALCAEQIPSLARSSAQCLRRPNPARKLAPTAHLSI
jgi:hypothetical protein